MINGLRQQWLEAKTLERDAAERRRQIEDRLVELLAIDQTKDGTFNDKDSGIKVTTRLSRKVDAEKLQEIAAEHGLSEHLSDLFRWQPEVNMKAWKSTDESITGPLQEAITVKPGRPTFSIANNSVEEE